MALVYLFRFRHLRLVRLLVGDDQEYPPSAFVPLFRRKDEA